MDLVVRIWSLKNCHTKKTVFFRFDFKTSTLKSGDAKEAEDTSEEINSSVAVLFNVSD